jgi:hypothetical protein
MGGIGLQPGFSAGHPVGIAGYLIAGLLIAAGLLLIGVRRPIAFYGGVLAALLTAVSGLLAFAGRTHWALPVPPILSMVVGLYLCIRLAIARSLYFPAGEESDR